jgi:hypothetical protein
MDSGLRRYRPAARNVHVYIIADVACVCHRWASEWSGTPRTSFCNAQGGSRHSAAKVEATSATTIAISVCPAGTIAERSQGGGVGQERRLAIGSAVSTVSLGRSSVVGSVYVLCDGSSEQVRFAPSASRIRAGCVSFTQCGSWAPAGESVRLCWAYSTGLCEHSRHRCPQGRVATRFGADAMHRQLS